MNHPTSPLHSPSTAPTNTTHPRRGLGWLNRLLAVCLLWLSAAQPGLATPLAPAAPTSGAATITVTNTNDKGPGSLRQAIADASPGDTIVIGVTGTIFLLSGELVISKNLTIQGPGAGSLSLSGEFQKRVLRVTSGVTVGISQVTIKEGLSETNGGGIYNDGNLTLTDSVVVENTSSGASGTQYGGGLYSTGSLTLINTTVRNNAISGNQPSGSAIYSTGLLILNNATVYGNGGGVVITSAGGARISESTIHSNSGSAIDSGNRTLDISNTTISSNSGYGIVGNGAITVTNVIIANNSEVGISIGSGNLILITSQIYKNGSHGILSYGTARISGSTIRENGNVGIYNVNTLFLEDTTVNGNINTTNPYQGGGVYNSGVFTATNSTITENRIGNPHFCTSAFGSGVFNKGIVYLFNNTIVNNSMTRNTNCSGGFMRGGGIYSDPAGTTYLRNTIVGNNSANEGSDVYGTMQSEGYNFIGTVSGAMILGATVGNQSGDARLAPLADNGGPTLTHALLSDSPAIDGGKPTGCRDGENVFLATDQRGAARTVDGNNDGSSICDIGAYEFGSELVPTPTPDPVSAPSLNSVTPTEGTSAGGTSITLQGGNFQSGMTVSLDGAACANVVVNNSNNATCTTPSHFPAVVDVAVTNPGGQRATLLRGFTYRGGTASLSLPDTIADSGSTVQIPVQATGIGGLMAVSLTVSYDSGKATLRNVTAGTLTGGWSTISNTVSSGRVQISMANPGAPAQGDGSLALLHFQVTGSPGQTSPLSIVGVSLNDGTIPTTTTAGSLIVDSLSTLAGQVGYWTESRPVPGVGLSLTGTNSRSATSDSSGLYSLADVPSGSYTLSPSKSDGVGTDAITSFDASLVLRHSAGVEILTGNAATVADVDRSGSITPMDASYILRKSVRLIDVPFPGAGQVWAFAPASRSYAPLTGDQSAQNFTALLLGDVSGNWGSSQSQGRATPETVRLTLGEAGRSGLDGHTLSLAPNATPIYSLDLILRYPPESGATPVVALAALSQSFALGSNSPEAGLLYSALAGVAPIQSGGDLLVIRWVDGSGNPVPGPALQIVEARVNEGRIPATVETSGWGQLFLPTVGR
ncbi:MAG: IPT/TIG domain-containing protein [Caldilineaceae bacterium]|nr:IPT/TIG domain-containing protein [Caldilineaceae bacterium]